MITQSSSLTAGAERGALELLQLSAGYGSNTIIFNISLTCPLGCVTSIVGPNGAGKSTVLKALFGQANLESGTGTLNGRKVALGDAAALVGVGIGYVPQSGGVFPNLSVADNLRIGGFARNRGSLDETLDLFPEIASFMKRPAGKLSGGQQRMVAIGRALQAGPDVLLLDEATSGLAPNAAIALWARIKTLSQKGVGVVAVEQNVDLALAHSDKLAVIVGGHKVLDAPPESVSMADLEAAFLSSDAERSLGHLANGAVTDGAASQNTTY